MRQKAPLSARPRVIPAQAGIQAHPQRTAGQLPQSIQQDIHPRALDLTDESSIKLCGPSPTALAPSRSPTPPGVVARPCRTTLILSAAVHLARSALLSFVSGFRLRIAQCLSAAQNENTFQVDRHASIVVLKQVIFRSFCITFGQNRAKNQVTSCRKPALCCVKIFSHVSFHAAPHTSKFV